jgi:CRISPR/Cas system CSM-associated protein Csm2 small subunit
MFSIHNFREQWELMPTALGLKSVMETLRETDNAVLTKLTGLSDPQIERCKKLLEFPEKYQQLSLEQNPEERIPSNFWIELYPVLELIDKELPDLKKRLGRDGITDALVDKYRANRIKSVIHFRRIIEAYEVAEARRPEVLARVKEYVQNTNLETRQAFDEFVVDNRRTQSAVDACTSFVRELKRLKIDYATFDRRRVRRALEAVRTYADELIEKLKGQDPRVGEATGEDEE